MNKLLICKVSGHKWACIGEEGWQCRRCGKSSKDVGISAEQAQKAIKAFYIKCDWGKPFIMEDLVEASSPRKALKIACEKRGMGGLFPRHQVLPPGDHSPDHLGDPYHGDWRGEQIAIGDSIEIVIKRIK